MMERFKIKLVRRVEIEIVVDRFETVTEVRRWIASQDMDNLQHEGEIVSDECKLRSVTR